MTRRMQMQKHRFNKLPEMRSEDYAALLESLKNFGYDKRYPVVFYENAILDGWNRYKACAELDIVYTDEFFTGTDAEAIDFVHRTNTRRNLTPNEQAELIGRYYEDIKSAHGDAIRFAPSGRTDHLEATPADTAENEIESEPVYEADEYSQIAETTRATARKKAAHAYGVSESKVKRSAEYTRALDAVPTDIQEVARAGRISQAEVVRIATGNGNSDKPKFDRQEMRRLVGSIAFEVEALADTFPNTREVCNRVLDLCRKAQEYTGV